MNSAPSHARLATFALLAVWILTPAPCQAAKPPEWIWGNQPKDGETRLFRHSFMLPAAAEQAQIALACDNGADLLINGRRAVRNREWSKPSRLGNASLFRPGSNYIFISAINSEGIAGLLFQADLRLQGGERRVIVSDASWETVINPSGQIQEARPPAEGWTAATSLGAVGREPWGDVLKPKVATPAESLKTLPGFRVSLLRSASPEEGSWVATTLDPKGRLIVSPQGNEPMLRMTLAADGSVAKVEQINLPVSGAMGLLHAFGGLYVNGQGKDGYHLYKLTDTNSDDTYDTVTLVRKWAGGSGEHGAHGIVAGTDGKLYIVNGNFVDVPKDVLPSSPHRNYADDVSLPRFEDGNGFGAGRKPPGGYVVRLNPDGSQCELFASGQRNAYDIAFSPDGELFSFDSDMEWDWGMPWYRPTRIFQIVSGGDQGFREGSAKQPEYYADSLPATVNIGIGSPTGVAFGTGSKFPARYQKALYAMDWSYGRIVAVHLKEVGAGYEGTFESFIQGKPLNVTDMVVGADGSLYFLTGGRGTQAGLYRVSYHGTESVTPVEPTETDKSAIAARTVRRNLEAWHGKTEDGAVEKIWPHLGHSDRWIRYAARIALESQPVATWQERAAQEPNSLTGLHAWLAMARVGGKERQPDVLKGLARWPLDSLSEEEKLLKLRVVQVSLARHGLPSADVAAMAVEKLSRQFPSTSWALNRELAELLTALNAPGVGTRMLDLLQKAPTQQEKMHLLACLSRLKEGWNAADRGRFLALLRATSTSSEPPQFPADFQQWFSDVGSKPVNGASFPGFLKRMRDAASARMTAEEREQFTDLLRDAEAPKKASAPRAFVKKWAAGDISNDLAAPLRGRNFAKGKAAYEAAQCLACHKLGSAGGATGPDLTGLASRFSRTDILSSILEPSKVVSEQYASTVFGVKDGDDVTGRLLEETADRVTILTSPLTGGTTQLRKSDITSRKASALSSMPEGLVDTLTREEILDLMAFLESGGDATHQAFKK